MNAPRLGSLLVLASLTCPIVRAQAPRDPSPAPEKFELPGGELSMPVSWFMKKPVVELKINGKGPFSFYLDTGAQGSVLDQDLADELQLPTLGKRE